MLPVARVVAGAILAVLVASPALAQTRARVTVDRTPIWRQTFLTVVTVVLEGTELEVVSRQGDWLEVVVPSGTPGDRLTGFVSIHQVSVVSGTLPESGRPAPAAPVAPLPGQRPPAGRVLPPDTGFRGFGDASYNWFTANDSFKAVLDQSYGAFLGGGLEFRAPSRWFAQGAVRWFRKTGERAFVLDDEVFPLGIPETVTIVPVSFTFGYRMPARNTYPYFGGGAGAYYFKETSDFALPEEDIDTRFASYHLVGGVEFRGRSWIAAAVEVQYTFVPNSLSGPIPEAFDEDDLGGLEVRFKMVFGR
jgi:hypothetical protein